MIIALKIIGLVIVGAGCWICFRLMNEAFSMIANDTEEAFRVTHPGWDDEPKRTVRQMERKVGGR